MTGNVRYASLILVFAIVALVLWILPEDEKLPVKAQRTAQADEWLVKRRECYQREEARNPSYAREQFIIGCSDTADKELGIR